MVINRELNTKLFSTYSLLFYWAMMAECISEQRRTKGYLVQEQEYEYNNISRWAILETPSIGKLLIVDIFIQAPSHPLPPSTAVCWPLKAPAGWSHPVCSEREVILAKKTPAAKFLFIQFTNNLLVLFSSHLSTTSMSKQKRLSIESVFLRTHERSLNISGVLCTTPFC